MKMLKKIISVIAIFTSVNTFADASTSIFVRENSELWLPSIEAAFEMYIGNWVGSETILEDGREVANAEVVQNYLPSKASAVPRLVCSGKIVFNGNSIPTSSYMYIRDGRLEIDIKTLDDDVVQYVGKIEKNSVVWTPKFLFYAFDVQADCFYKTNRGIAMSSIAKKFVQTKGFSGYIDVSMLLERDSGSFNQKDVKTFQTKSFSGSSIGGSNE